MADANSVGRPTELTEIVRAKIDQAAAFGASIEEIAMYSGVSRTTMYRWIKEDAELRDRILELQEKPILLARQTVVKAVADNPDIALKYLERKRKDEFSTKTENKHSGGLTTYVIRKGTDNLSPALGTSASSGTPGAV